MIIDVGANMNAKAEDLYQYGIMGAIYAEEILGVTHPRIGLLERRHRGREGDRPDPRHPRPLPGEPLGQPVRRQRRGTRHLRGPCPGRHLRRLRRQRPAQGRRGGRRVPVLDAPGGARPDACRSCPSRPATGSPAACSSSRAGSSTRSSAAGPLLGIRGACIICHGASGARAIKNALRVAHAMAEDRLNQRIVEQLGARASRRADERGRSAAATARTSDG